MQSEGKSQSFRTWGALGACLILALALRLWCADYSPWFDEWMSAWFAGRPLSDLWSTWMVQETNPPLYYSLLKLWTLLFGARPEAMRSLGILAGVASAGMLAACANITAGRRAVAIAGLLAAISAQQVFYSTQIRAYIFAELAFAASLSGLLLLLREDRTDRQRTAAAATYALGSAAAIYFHTTMILWPISATATAFGLMALRQVSPRQFAYVFAAGVAIATLASWWLYITALQMAAGTRPIAWIPDTSLRDYISLLRQTVFLAKTNVWPLKAVSFLMIALSLGGLAGKHRKAATQIGVLFITSCVVFFIANRFKPIILSRTLFWMNGLVVLLVSATLAELRPAWLRALAVTGLCILLAADLAQARGTFLSEEWQRYLRFQSGDSQATVIVDGTASAIVAQKACTAELATPCPLHLAVIPSPNSSRDGIDAGGPAILSLKAGSPPPISGQVYLLDTAGGRASRRFSLPPGTPLRKFANLELLGPVAAEQIVAK